MTAVGRGCVKSQRLKKLREREGPHLDFNVQL